MNDFLFVCLFVCLFLCLFSNNGNLPSRAEKQLPQPLSCFEHHEISTGLNLFLLQYLCFLFICIITRYTLERRQQQSVTKSGSDEKATARLAS